MSTFLWTIVVLLPAADTSGAANWPQFRGPGANGDSEARDLPRTWDETQNVAWKTRIHGRGWSSPVIWESQIWLTTATEDGRQLFAVCVDRDTGEILHDIRVFEVENPEHIAVVNSYASPTSAIEKGRVYVHYGTYGTACLDTKTGRIVWARRDLNCDHHEGPGSSLMLFDKLLIFHVDGRDVQYVVALDKTTGQTVWKTERSIDFTQYNENFRKAFCTPIVIDWQGRKELVSPGAKAVMAYDPYSGKELWKALYNGWSVTPRPLFGHGLLFVVTDFVRPELWAIRPGGNGDVSETNVVWKLRKSIPKAPSLLLIGDLLFFVNDDGVAQCIEAKTGHVFWTERIGGKHWASPVFADGCIYFVDRDGVVTMIEPSRTFRRIGVNQMNEECMASPAIAGRAIFLRTATSLYRLEKPLDDG
ncbi:MAG: PQQ-binding-like beta-propeller repeat protein [Pirellulaceae bacterium]|nr:PQQ-binding-like beta-propeller repeat protein [Pirellulaceae bacterium]